MNAIVMSPLKLTKNQYKGSKCLVSENFCLAADNIPQISKIGNI